MLLIASLFFYTYGEKALVLIMIVSTLVDYKCGLLIESGKRKLGLRLSIIFNLLTLGFFKYFNFGIENLQDILISIGVENELATTLPQIALPLGISFYVFQTMSYTIDVYRADVKASRNILEFATYVTMFPQLVAGPIIRYIDVQKELVQRSITVYSFSKGLERFTIGLAKKMLIANTFASVSDNIFFESGGDISTFNAWFGLIAYSIQIYFDFSGYSDMAIGLGRMLGFNFPENFDYPYISKSIQEFWRRWHISLSTWFRDYLYIPLGGNRGGGVRTYMNLTIVFLITGLWHGASWNFIIWGLFHGAFLIVERLGFGKILSKAWRPLQHIYTLLVVNMGWVLFKTESLPQAYKYYQKLFTFQSGDASVNDFIAYFNYNNESYIAFAAAILFSMPVYMYCERKFTSKYYLLFRYSFVITLLFFSIVYVAASSYNPFIYFRF